MGTGRSLALSIAVALLALPQASAQQQPLGSPVREEHDLALWLAHGESDNIVRTQDDPLRTSYQSAGLTFDLSRDGPRLRAELKSDLEYRRYGTAFDNELLGNLELSADIAAVPDRFNWSARNVYGNGRSDPFLPDSPQNRECINVFSTGPEVIVPFGQRSMLVVSGAYSDRRYEESDELDSNAMLYEVGLFRQVRRRSRIGFVAESSDVEYDSDLPGYRIDSGYVRYQRTLASGGMVADFGGNKVTGDDVKTTGPSLRFSWDRAITTRSDIAVFLRREFTDSGALFNFAGSEPGVDPATGVVLSSNPFEQRNMGLTYGLSLPRTTVSWRASRVRDEFERDSLYDNDSTSASMTIERRMNARLSVGFLVDGVTREFVIDDREDRDRVMRIWLTRQLGPHFALEGRVAKYERRGTHAFEERNYEVRAIYNAGTRR